MSRALAAVCLAFTCLAAAGADLRVAAAAKSGSLDQIRALIAQRVDVNAAEADGTTALHWAVRRDDVETVRVLLTAGAKADASNRYGVTPVALAAVNGSAPALAALLDAGADPNTASPYNVSVLTQTAALFMLERLDLLEQQAARILSERKALGESLKALKGLTVFPSEANFFLIRVPDADRTHAALKQQNVLVRNLNPGIRNCLRVTVGTPDENRILVTALREALS